MAATLDDLLANYQVRQRDAAMTARLEPDSTPEPKRVAPETPAWLAEAFAKIDAMAERCDALIERNGVWTRYTTGGDNA